MKTAKPMADSAPPDDDDDDEAAEAAEAALAGAVGIGGGATEKAEQPGQGEKAGPPEKNAKRRAGIAPLFNLRRDLDEPDDIDANVRGGVDVAGTNLWVLFFAILVASVGLNVNSTAAIIGAMLISPLMGPIVGIGYGLAVHDMVLIRRALRNLAIFTTISLATSTLYFAVTPLRDAGSELLARTTPTLWDVMIAFFGGSAGIVALTRKSISNVIPGVAIATALMPPLCTVGFGLSQGNLDYVGGAFFLFLINGVFIAFSTFLFCKLIRLPLRGAVSDETRFRARAFSTVAVVGVLLPSAWLTWQLIEAQRFEHAVAAQLNILAHDEDVLVLDREVDTAKRRVHLTLSTERRNERLAPAIAGRLAQQGFANAAVTVRFSGTQDINVGSLKQELREDVFRQVSRDADTLRGRVQALEADNKALREAVPDYAQLIAELQAQYPDARDVAMGLGMEARGGGTQRQAAILVQITQRKPMARAERERLQRWLAVRMPGRAVHVSVVAA